MSGAPRVRRKLTHRPEHRVAGWASASGDGSSGAGRKIVEEGGVGSASASHGFSTPGMYAVTATVAGRDGRRTTVSQTVVVTGPAAPHDGTVPSNI
jgi:hypothetical protein